MNELILPTLKAVTVIAFLVDSYFAISGIATSRVYAFGNWYFKHERPYWMAVFSHFALMIIYVFLYIKISPEIG